VLRFALVATLMSLILAACGDRHLERGATGARLGGGLAEDEDFWDH
jgi:hypothetical protein